MSRKKVLDLGLTDDKGFPGGQTVKNLPAMQETLILKSAEPVSMRTDSAAIPTWQVLLHMSVIYNNLQTEYTSYHALEVFPDTSHSITTTLSFYFFIEVWLIYNANFHCTAN